ncbi:Uncharacterized protein LOCC1_G003041 [Lachnellula occidentalis]|uniref:ER membrane protein n=1 Tax=Lachnellula occidentalis TaxID=215460 RepID=A0A8H8RZ57_9HELO|nr:Uncharacterized protein LOCC1_G003041 [Lachnellula occidentalis]
MWFFRVLSSAIFLLSIILSIPIAFDVGGRDCGLAFSLSLFYFYFFFSTLKLATPEGSRIRWALIQLISMGQWILLPGLLIWSMNRFAVDANANGDWVARTFDRKRAQDTGFKEWIFGSGGLLEAMTVGTWDVILRYSTPLFQMAEGFCSLLVIQAAGQITRWLVNRGRGSDTWMIGLLVLSASIISSSVYFLWRITNFPEISNVDASLIGVTITCAVFLCGWGIGSGRGNPVESSLLFAYVVLCIYQIFTDYLPASNETPPPPAQPEFPPFPPIIMASYSTLVYVLSTLPSAVHSGLTFFYAAFQTITPSVIISLAYRIFVFYAATRIIPAVRESGARALSEEPSLDDSDGAGKILGLLSWFSPSILVAVYTSLLMQHFATAEGNGAEWWTMQGGDAGGNIWRWINVAATMALYALELYLGKEDMDGSLTGHWKTD